MNEKIDIYELVKRCPDATIQIRAGDLSFFSRKLLADARLEFERQQAEASSEKAETYLDDRAQKAGNLDEYSLSPREGAGHQNLSHGWKKKIPPFRY